MTYLSDLVLLFILLEHPLVHGHFLAVPTVNIISSYRACPEIEEILQQIRRNISDSLDELFSTSVPECGNGLWYRVAYLNMTDPSQPCPPAWREYNTSGVRGCRRPVFSRGSRPADFYTQAATSNCPCSPAQGAEPQEFIGSNYYCESGFPSNGFIPLEIFTSDPLWDGEQCEGTCCSGTKSPPWFSVQLPTSTTDRIEVCICADESTSNENVLIELLEIFVQ